MTSFQITLLESKNQEWLRLVLELEPAFYFITDTAKQAYQEKQHSGSEKIQKLNQFIL